MNYDEGFQLLRKYPCDAEIMSSVTSSNKQKGGELNLLIANVNI